MPKEFSKLGTLNYSVHPSPSMSSSTNSTTISNNSSKSNNDHTNTNYSNSQTSFPGHSDRNHEQHPLNNSSSRLNTSNFSTTATSLSGFSTGNGGGGGGGQIPIETAMIASLAYPNTFKSYLQSAHLGDSRKFSSGRRSALK